MRANHIVPNQVSTVNVSTPIFLFQPKIILPKVLWDIVIMQNRLVWPKIWSFFAVNIPELEGRVLGWWFWRQKFIMDIPFIPGKQISDLDLWFLHSHLFQSQTLWTFPLETGISFFGHAFFMFRYLMKINLTFSVYLFSCDVFQAVSRYQYLTVSFTFSAFVSLFEDVRCNHVSTYQYYQLLYKNTSLVIYSETSYYTSVSIWNVNRIN